MVPPSRTPLRADRLRSLNAARAVRVEADAAGTPLSVDDGVPRAVELIRESWRVDDEWWRAPIARHYFDLVLEGGKRVLLFRDLLTGDWSLQLP